MSVNANIVTGTFLDALVARLEEAGEYNRQDQAPPAAVLWPDKERQWESLIPRLRMRLPIFTLGPYMPEEQTGPAYWLRCIIARTIEHPGFPLGSVPILYLPGFSRQDVRAVETCPRQLQPLAELQYRGVLWTQKNGRDWSIAAFLQSDDRGLGVEVAGDAATREALRRALVRLADEPVATLYQEAPIRAAFLDDLLNPDHVKAVLRWLNDPAGFRAEATPEDWAAFVAQCLDRYRFHPEKDGPVSAARLLGQRDGAWASVWRRFAEAPAAYTAVPDILRRAKPAKLLPMLDAAESWPQENDAAEAVLRGALAGLASHDPESARRTVLELEQQHGERRGWVWASLGQAALARALEHLAILAGETAQPLSGASPAAIAAAYVEGGWRADLAVLNALAAVETAEDAGVLREVIRVVYRPWLEAGATALQHAIAQGGPPEAASPMLPPEVAEGTCVLFTDGLRFDAAQRLSKLLTESGLECATAWGFAALPSVTATAKPSVSPAAGLFTGGSGTGLEPALAETGTKAGIEVLRKALAAAGLQVLTGDDLGDPAGRAWTELGDIDAYGHQFGLRLAHQLERELRLLRERMKALLDHGWQRVVVVTDHGWLLLPGGLPKAELPEHLTEVRKGRCARLKPGSQTDMQVVPWRWDAQVRIAVAPGIHCFEANMEYEHGGISPQECVVPVLTVSRAGASGGQVAVKSVIWRRLRCNIEVSGGTGLRVDLRTKAGDPGSSLVGSSKGLAPDGTAALFVDDDDREGQGAVVVVVAADGSIRAQVGTIVGGA